MYPFGYLMQRTRMMIDLPKELDRDIREYAKSRSITKSAVVKLATSKFLENEKNGT